MKVLVTGANGFLGSHIVESLCRRGVATTLLLRHGCDTGLIQQHLPKIEVRTGSMTDSRSLELAFKGITHVIHCAGCTKAVRPSEFFAVNQQGTRNIVDAVNRHGGVRRLVHVSSLAAVGPATPEKPAREDDPPHPVSAYGKSKLAAEHEVSGRCRTEYVIVRPPAVYGPCDRGFLSLFRAVKNHLLPLTNSRQALSLVFVRDLAAAIVECLDHPAAAGRTYFVAAHPPVTGRGMAREIADQMRTWTVPVPLPAAALWPVCLAQEIMARVTGRAALLSLSKFPELEAPGWVCDPSRLERELGVRCKTVLAEGVAETLQWYRDHDWLR